ncbi:NLR family CARD domain-containing protein 3-like [Ptychodera flava]|uniref:NLR family CARD domain-containing protein 3-like n=1 Tax=Ptychodera flava TaxID=63121 RepID=UPI00396A9469
MVGPIIIHGSVSGMAVGDHSTLHVGNSSVSEQTSSPQLEEHDDEGLVFRFEGSPLTSHYVHTDSPSKVGVPESQQPVTSKERTVRSIQELEAGPGITRSSKTAPSSASAEDGIPSCISKVCRRHLEEVYSIRFEKYTAVTLYQKHELEMNVYVPLRFRDVNKAIHKQVDIPQDQLDLSTDQRIVIYGGSGQGKTTFCQHIVYIWSKEFNKQTETESKCNKLSKFDLVFYLEGKRIGSGMSIIDAVFDQLLPRAEIIGIGRVELEHWIQENQEKVCFIFDALDEVPSTDHALSKFINLEYLVKTHAIFTAQNLPVIKCRKYYGVCNFVGDDVSEYIRLFFQKDQGKAKGLQEQLQSNCNLRCIMSNPLFCLLMCVHWKYNEDKFKPATETELFKDIFDLSLTKYSKTHSISKTQLKQRCFVNYSLAWKGTREGKLTFTEKEITCELEEEGIEDNVTVGDVVGLGFLVTIVGHSKEGLIYSFTHSMFRQLLAAMYVKEVNKNGTYDECWSRGKSHESRQSMENVCVFLAGLLGDLAAPFFDAFGRQYKALMENENAPIECAYRCILLVCRCLAQSKSPHNYTHSIVSSLSEQKRVFLNVFRQDLADHTLVALSYMLESDHCRKNKCHGVIQSLLLSNFEDVGDFVLKRFCKALKNCKWLEELDLCLTSLSSGSCRQIIEAVALNRSVKNLSIEVYLDSMEEEAILAIPRVLHIKKLEALRLFAVFVKQCPLSCKVARQSKAAGDHGQEICRKRQAVGNFVKAFAEALKQNRTLKSLILTDCFFNDCPNSDELKLAILNHPELVSLSVSGLFNGSGQISADGMKILSDIVRSRKLSKFTLSLTTLSPSAAEYSQSNSQVETLLDALSDSSSLQKLKFTFTCLSVAHQLLIVDFIKCSQLNSVKLIWKTFYPSFLKRLGEAFAEYPAPDSKKRVFLKLKGEFRSGATRTLLKGIKDNPQIERVILHGNPFQVEFISEFVDEIETWTDRRESLCLMLEGEIVKTPPYGRPLEESELYENDETTEQVTERLQSFEPSCRNVTIESQCTASQPQLIIMDNDCTWDTSSDIWRT